MQLSDQCRAVIANAQEVAHGYNHDYVGTEHLLLALLEIPGVAAEVLQSFGITASLVDLRHHREPGRRVDHPDGRRRQRRRTVAEPGAAQQAGRRSLRARGTDPRPRAGRRRTPAARAAPRPGWAGRADRARRRGDPQLIRDEQVRRISTSTAHTTGISDSIEVTHSPRLRRLLMTASARALDDGRVEAEPADVLLALMRDETAGPVLAELGVDERAIRLALAGRDAAGTSGRAGDV